jgi:hypothetical protein
MKNKLFDDFVQKQFDGYKPEVGAHIWENIARQKEKQKPVGFWFSTIGKVAATFLVILSSIAIGYYCMHNKNTSTKEISKNKEKSIVPSTNTLQQNTIIDEQTSATITNNNKKVLPIIEQTQSIESLSTSTNKINKNNSTASIIKTTENNYITNSTNTHTNINGKTI